MSRPRPATALAAGLGLVLVTLCLVAALLGADLDGSGDGAGSGSGSGAAAGDPAEGGSEPFPDAASTGVPAGVVLVPYAGPCTLTETVVLSRVDATGTCPAIVVQAAGVRIEESRVPRVEATASQVDPTFSVEVVDSEVVAGAWVDGAVWGDNLTVRRVDVTGGQHSVHCGSRCVVEDSWLHDQHNPAGGAAHNNAFISNGGTDIVVRHNTLHCTPELNDTGGGCTADLSLFGDFAAVSDVLVEDNLFKANASSVSYCAYGGTSPGKPFPTATGVVFTGNVFERGTNGSCGVYGPVTSFDPGAQDNVWSDNTWDDGTALTP